MRVTEAAKELGISAATLRRLDRDGTIQMPRDFRGHRRISSADLEILRRLIYPSERQLTPKGSG